MGWVGKRHKSLALNGLGSDASGVGPERCPLPPGWHGRTHLGLVWAAPSPEIIPPKTAKNRRNQHKLLWFTDLRGSWLPRSSRPHVNSRKY